MVFPLEQLVTFNGNMYEITVAASLRAYQMAKVLGVNPAWLMGFDIPKHEKIDPEATEKEIEEARELYEKYLQAIPEIRSAIDALLKPKSDP